jgi:hypothetical protein
VEDGPRTADGAPTLEDGPVGTGAGDPDRHDAAFLVIHGIGDQRPGETLVTVADAVTGATDFWLRFRASARLPTWERLASPDTSHGEPRARVTRAHLHPTDDDASPECTIEVDEGHRVTRILGVEAYWADAFSIPQYVELLRWSILVVPWAVVEHFVRRLEKVRKPRARLGVAQDEARGWPVLREIVILLIATMLAPVFVGLLGAAWVVSWIPFDATRNLARQIISGMSATIGDSYVLLGSPARSAAIVDRATRQLQSLSARVPDAERIWIVAHSQGCAVARAVLLRMREQVDDATLCRRFGLVTVGSGLRKLSALRSLDRHTNPAWLVMIFVCTSTFILAAAALTWREWAQPWYLASGIGGNLTILLVFGFAIVRAHGRVDATRWRQTLRRLVMLVCAVVATGGIVTLSFGLYFARDPLTHALALLATLSSVAAGGGLAASHLLIGWHTEAHPDQLDLIGDLEWHDFYATHDAVPNGPIDLGTLRPTWDPATPHRRTSTQVLNRASLLADHTSYFGNGEQVVLPIAHMLLGGRLVDATEHASLMDAVRRRTRFVIVRRLGMWLVLGATAGLVLVQADRVLGWNPRLPDALSSLVDGQIAAPWLRMGVLAAVPLLAVATVLATWRLELGWRSQCVMRRHRLRWTRLTVAVIGLWSATALGLMMWSPTPAPVEPLLVERGPGRLRAILAGAATNSRRADTIP